ncbi:MAG: hypothetical protein ACPK85_10895 [Methanosarcina sp.]
MLAALAVITLPRPELFNNELLRNEQVLWMGQPEKSGIFSREDLFFIPFSLFWLSITTSIGIMFLSSGELFPILFVLPFLLVGLYLLIGRIIHKRYLKKRTYYVVTNQRVLILTNLFSRNLQSEFINNIPVINKTVRKDGIGTIQFGNYQYTGSMQRNPEFNFTGFGYGIPTFYDIKGVDNVYQIVNNLRKKEFGLND